MFADHVPLRILVSPNSTYTSNNFLSYFFFFFLLDMIWNNQKIKKEIAWRTVDDWAHQISGSTDRGEAWSPPPPPPPSFCLQTVNSKRHTRPGIGTTSLPVVSTVLSAAFCKHFFQCVSVNPGNSGPSRTDPSDLWGLIKSRVKTSGLMLLA